MMNTNLIPARAPSPGRIIRRELEARGWTQKDLATIMDRPEQSISQIVKARKKITSETALQLAAAFGTSADFWLNLESSYQIYQARKTHNASKIERRSRLYSLAPVTELLRRGWIAAGDSLDDLETAVCQFLGIEDPTQTPHLAVNFHHSDSYTPELAAQIAWVKRVEQLAEMQVVEDFDRSRLEEALPELLAFAANVEDLQKIPDFLKRLGVHFLIVPHLPNTYLDGATFMLGDHPVVALTLRHNRIDNFWFILMHELAHIISGHTGIYLDNLEKEAVDSDEIEANRLAQAWLVDTTMLKRFVAENAPRFSREKIVAFAETQNRHPGIVVGQLHYAKAVPYRNFRPFLVKVSSYFQF
ncbi:MAG: HigA family addiction module antitoxin [Anaerolineae bacterium]